MTTNYLAETKLLDFSAPTIQGLLQSRGWPDLKPYEQIGAAYDFVRDEIAFGYNRRDDIPATAVLTDGYGQCNTKATLLMALLRGLGIPCRLHGFTIHKALQRGVVPEPLYALAPDSILHSWVEISHDLRWIALEGFILDRPFLSALQNGFQQQRDSLCGFGAGTDCLSDPPVDWVGTDTYIQKTGINADLGLFDTPDDFYARHRQNFGPLRELTYRYMVRHWMNYRVRRVRSGNMRGLSSAIQPHSHV